MINEPKHKKLEENYTKSPYNQIAQPVIRRKIIKSATMKNRLYNKKK